MRKLAVGFSFAVDLPHSLTDGWVGHAACSLAEFGLRQATVTSPQPQRYVPPFIAMPVTKMFPRLTLRLRHKFDDPRERKQPLPSPEARLLMAVPVQTPPQAINKGGSTQRNRTPDLDAQRLRLRSFPF